MTAPTRAECGGIQDPEIQWPKGPATRAGRKSTRHWSVVSTDTPMNVQRLRRNTRSLSHFYCDCTVRGAVEQNVVSDLRTAFWASSAIRVKRSVVLEMHENEFPLWQGSVQPVVNGEGVWRENRDMALWRLAVEMRRPLILIGRNSGSSGRGGARLAVENLFTAARGLARRTGFDVEALLPSESELVELLMNPSNMVRSKDAEGNTFINRFVLLDYSEHGFIVSFSTGSALKTDGEFNQPHVRWIQRLLRELTPAGFFASQFDRVSRVGWQTNMLVEELRLLESRTGEVWACDDEYGMWSTSADAEFMHTVRGNQANTTAKQFKARSRRDRVALTGTRMESGRVQYGMSGGSIPPGLFSYRDRGTRRMVLCVDSPQFYPSADEVVYGLPDVRDARGELVDQAETVRWFLGEYARPGVSLRQAFDGLVQRRYSTNALRAKRDQGPAAYYGGPTRPVRLGSSTSCSSWVRALFDNLSLYETGVLRRSVGSGSDGTVMIEGVLPAAGAWATQDDIDRIRVKLSSGRQKSAVSKSWSWSAMPVVVNGSAGVLTPGGAVASDDDFAWRLTLRAPGSPAVLEGSCVGDRVGDLSSDGLTESDGRGDSPPCVNGHYPVLPAVPDKLLTAAIVKALVRADGQPLVPHLAADVVSEELEAAERELSQLRSERAAKEAAKEHCLELVMDGGVARGLLERVQAQYDGLEVSLVDLDRRIDAATQRVVSMSGTDLGVDVSAMAALVGGLRDPHSNRYRADLFRAVCGLTAQSTNVNRAKFKGVRVDVTGRLLFDVGGSAYELPFGFSYETGVAFQVEQRGLKALRALRDGRVVRYLHDGATRQSSAFAAELLGVDSSSFGLFACYDSRLLRLGMAAMFPEPVQGEDPGSVTTVEELAADDEFVADFGDVVLLASNMRSLYESFKGQQWLRVACGAYESEALIRMALSSTPAPCANADELRAVKHFRTLLSNYGRGGRWDFQSSMWPTLAPCVFCGSTIAGRLRIREAIGYLCLNAECRKDESGVRWPARFDRYMSRPEEWIEAGFTLTMPESGELDAKELKGEARDLVVVRKHKWRYLADVPERERLAIAAAYRDPSKTVGDISKEFRISRDALYDIVAAAGLPPRNIGRAGWPVAEGIGGAAATPEQWRAARKASERARAAERTANASTNRQASASRSTG